MKQYWGYSQFRPLQKEIITSVMEGHDTLAILPTGGGKSICFQVPAMAMDGICLVVSPLIALMKDQVENLKKKNIPALLIHSGMQRTDVIRTLKNATHDYFKFLYLSPERLETSLFKEYLPALNINLVAIDEAHCISQWGYDFRPSYLRIAALRKELDSVPILALTASATETVQEDICKKLEFQQHRVFKQSFERKNLSYSVFRADSKLARLTEIVSKVPGSGIVYCRSRRRTSEIRDLLLLRGIAASNYHAGLDAAERSSRQKDWIDNKVQVMVCTNAFGMGIDKPDVRFVVHADLPDCLESYYQEAGRAGRDGQKAYAVLLYDGTDLQELAALHLLRYPTLEQIRKVYKALVNFLQIPAYSGEYQSFNFRLEDFTTNFKLNSQEALYALKALESEGWMDFNEKSFSPATVVFTTSKSMLHEFQQSYPGFEPLITTLLRTYGGILDFPAFISEKLLAKLLRKDEVEIRKELTQLTAMGLISYAPQNELPQLIFRKQRVPAEEVSFNSSQYQKRKEAFVQRADKMIAYVQDTGCRSRFINTYFGDHSAKDCGICDNCLNRKSGEVSPEEFKKFSAIIEAQLSHKPLQAEELLKALAGLKKEKAWKILEFLQAENKIEVKPNGFVALR